MHVEGSRGGFTVLNANLVLGNVILTAGIFKRVERIGNSSFSYLRTHVSVKPAFISEMSVVWIYKKW